jgi:hypothetical protein
MQHNIRNTCSQRARIVQQQWASCIPTTLKQYTTYSADDINRHATPWHAQHNTVCVGSRSGDAATCTASSCMPSQSEAADNAPPELSSACFHPPPPHSFYHNPRPHSQRNPRRSATGQRRYVTQHGHYSTGTAQLHRSAHNFQQFSSNR